ncbi:hypothetical protein [Actinomadura sp. 3N508]|uniref:hypothetical protein n=1 Tax=Actinomadura sp. 3N508 TaxID=3375153 RepID=UPI003799E779
MWDPEEITAYLRFEGWRPSESGPLAQLWSHDRRPHDGLLVPLITTASDYPRRVTILFEDLARAEHRAVHEIEDDISLVFHDITRVRATHPDLLDGTIPFHTGLRLFQTAQRLIKASAAATIRRQGSFGSSMPVRAREHLLNVRLGQTQRGSYILPIISKAVPAPPVSDDPQEELDIGLEESLFDRRGTSTMSDALQTLHEIAVVRSEQRPSRQDVTDAVHDGVSRELCNAIDTALTRESVAELDVTFNWSRAAQAPMGATGQVSFPRAAKENVEYIADTLKKLPRTREHVLLDGSPISTMRPTTKRQVEKSAWRPSSIAVVAPSGLTWTKPTTSRRSITTVPSNESWSAGSWTPIQAAEPS